ncbi:MAG: S8 family serine peptidase, partial [Planctomycetes bacterium]|nr:S8 family serine peptidase [Planctomycetota bacterium]
CVLSFALVLALVDTIRAQDKASSPLKLGLAQKLPKPVSNARCFPSDLVKLKKLNAKNARRLLELPSYRGMGVVSDGAVGYVVCNVEFASSKACQEFNVEGASILTRFDRFADLFVSFDKTSAVFDALNANSGVTWFSIYQVAYSPPPRPDYVKKEKSRDIPERIVRGGVNGVKGKGVIIAILDSGIDFQHQDFVVYDENGVPTSRLMYFWDTFADTYVTGKVGEPAPFTFPNGAPIGTVYDRDDLTKELRGRHAIPVWDLGGHGTACASVAAGNGNASDGRYAGVAPEADLIAVRIGSGGRDIEHSYLVGAICEWLDKVAGDRPLIVSCSWGGLGGGYDGCEIVERQLSARFSTDRKGRALCIAGGNDGDFAFHSDVTIRGAKAPAFLRCRGGGTLQLYVQTGNVKDIAQNVQLYWGTIRADLPDAPDLEDFFDAFEGQGKRRAKQGLNRWASLMAPEDYGFAEYEGVNVAQPVVHPISGDVVYKFSLPWDVQGVYFYTDSGVALTADAYLYGSEFEDEFANRSKMLGTPANAINAITVGSYDWNPNFNRGGQQVVIPAVTGERMEIGRISTYSSPGPLRIGDVVKPDIVAPGQWHIAAATRNASNHPALTESSGLYTAFNGTSAATPYTAGVLALLLEKKPNLTVGEIKKLLATCASADEHTGKLPNPTWGNGKLDYDAVVKMLKQLD